MATIYFLRYFAQSVWPLKRDLKNRKKQLIFFKPEKTDMSMFNRYYLSLPISGNQLVELPAADFSMIKEGDFLKLEIGPNSQQIIRLMNGVNEIKFFRKRA
jgi:hypothetical protein